MFSIQCEERRSNHLIPLLVVTIALRLLVLVTGILYWGLQVISSFQFRIAFWRVILREVHFEGPNRVWRALKTSILNTDSPKECISLYRVQPLITFGVLDKNENSRPQLLYQLNLLPSNYMPYTLSIFSDSSTPSQVLNFCIEFSACVARV